MRKKLIISSTLFLLFTLIYIGLASAANVTSCTFKIGDTALANNLVINGIQGGVSISNVSILPVYSLDDGGQNATYFNFNFTNNDNINLTFANNLTTFPATNLSEYRNSSVNISYLYDQRYLVSAELGNKSKVFCSASYTNVAIDNIIITGNISTGSPADNSVSTTNQTFISISNANEQINNSKLFFGSKSTGSYPYQFVMTGIGTNKSSSIFSPTQQQIPAGTYDWYIQLTGTGGNTANTALRQITFAYSLGTINNQLSPDQLASLRPSTTNAGQVLQNNPLLIILAAAAAFYFVRKRGGK